VLLEGRELDPAVAEVMTLLATVLGQDLEIGEDGTFSIARRVAPDRVISVVDPEARHGHKTAAHSFDGFKAHAAIDPDSEIITATAVSAGNAGDASVAEELIADLLGGNDAATDGATGNDPADDEANGADPATERPTVYGDAAYGTGELQSRLADAGIDSKCKTQPPASRKGLYAKDRFVVDLERDVVTCPAEVIVAIRRRQDGTGIVTFGEACAACPLRAMCTASVTGRTIVVGIHEATLTRVRQEQADPSWRADYRATRPKVERKLGHLMRRRHGGRRARVRGTLRVGADFSLLAGAANLARLATLGARSTPSGGWVVAG
jgi:hypothetical protein